MPDNNDVIQEIKARLNIVDVVGASVPLSRAGRNFKGLCPFHGEKTPSFVVYPESQSYHCFGCGANGDIFGFIMATAGIEFREALERLASKAGVILRPRDDSEAARDRHRERLGEALTAAALYWHNLLVRAPNEGAKAARAYAVGRGLVDTTISNFSLGYAPDSWDATANYLRERGFSSAELLEAGLLVEREPDNAEAGTYDRFRNRLIFPIRDAKGRITGFGARALDDHPPKYLNSPQTPLYDKSSTLYGIDAAAAAIRAAGTAVIVEGYMDVLLAHQTGHANVVGASGTALTEKQATILKKLARRIVLALDADTAGELAALKGAEVLEGQMGRIPIPIFGSRGVLGIEHRLDAEIRIMTLPRGQDPDELLRADPTAWDRLLEEARPVVDHYIHVVTSGVDIHTARGKKEAVAQLAPLIRAIGDPVERAHWVQKLAMLTRNPVMIIEQAVSRAKAPAPSRRTADPPYSATPNTDPNAQTSTALRPSQPAAFTPEEYLLILLLRYPQAAMYQADQPASTWVRSENRLLAAALDKALSEGEPTPPEAVWERLRAGLEPALQVYFDYLFESSDSQPHVSPTNLAAEVKDRVYRLAKYHDNRLFDQCQFMIQEAQASGDTETFERLKRVLSLKPPQFMAYAPKKSTLFRDSRDPSPV